MCCGSGTGTWPTADLIPGSGDAHGAPAGPYRCPTRGTGHTRRGHEPDRPDIRHVLRPDEASTERAGLAGHRAALIATESGDVVEIGGGTGANLAYYGEAVTSLTITDPEPSMLRRLQRHVGEQPPVSSAMSVLRAPAEELPFDDESFDVAVSTLALCTVDDQPRALQELRRVLRPGGSLLFLEHVRAEDPRLARWQDRVNGINRVVAAGCNCNRRTAEGIASAGFAAIEIQHAELPKAPPTHRPLVVGRATTSATTSLPVPGAGRPS